MSRSPKLIAFAGSSRAASLNKKLVRVAAAGATEAGADVSVLDLADHVLPLLNLDLEEESGVPEVVQSLQARFLEADGFLIASPEHNGSVSAELKNLLDWLSRKSPVADSPLAVFKGKTAILMSASPGGLGGLRGLVHLRAILGNIGVLVLPDQRAVGKAHELLPDDGGMSDERQAAGIEALGATLAAATAKFIA